jgi:DNA recombination protein RmuC
LPRKLGLMDITIYIIIGILALMTLLVLLNRRPVLSTAVPAVSKDLYDAILVQNESLKQELNEKEQELRSYSAQLAARDQQLTHLEQTLQTRHAELTDLQQQFKTAFENVANRLFDEKSQSFSRQNTQQLDLVLAPLRDKIKAFEDNIERKFLQETRDKSALQREIEQLRLLNQQLSHDANNLATALKGQNKTQGDWGELQLEILLERAGLQKGTHFTTQTSFRNDEGLTARPDFILQLPENRQLIIDAKVSLTAFERFFNENDPERKARHLKAHLDSIRSHVDNLSRKNYQLLYQINTPDYLMLFVPIDQALNLAVQHDPALFNDALERNIVLVTNSSIFATIRTVAFLWKQEKQTRSVQEIARQGGLLYDKFVAFTEDLRNVGTRMDHARTAYDEAMQKLLTSTRPGDTLVGRAERLRQLGAKVSKNLPPEWLENSEE